MSRLRGLSKFHVSNSTLGLLTQDLDSVVDTVNCLQLVAHQILITSSSELRLFSAFSVWIRQEIDVQSVGASTLEAAEKDLNVDHASALEYIQGAMMQSQLAKIFALQEQSSQGPRLDLVAEDRSLFDLYKRELANATKGDLHAGQLPGLETLINHLESQCTTIFGRVAETQKRNVRFGSPICLGKGVPKAHDMRMTPKVRQLDYCIAKQYTDSTLKECWQNGCVRLACGSGTQGQEVSR